MITNEEVEAILDGCPKLKSLDLRRCFCLDLHGALGKRCYEHIKDLKCPYDSIFGDEWLKSTDDNDDEDEYNLLKLFV
ncbi:hypothetical protein ACS0TY_032498 [Phlomoides rotata]